MRAHLGTRAYRCRDCGAVLHLPYDWTRRPDRQPFRLGYCRRRMAIDHAQRMPLLHPTLLPHHHRLTGRRA